MTSTVTEKVYYTIDDGDGSPGGVQTFPKFATLWTCKVDFKANTLELEFDTGSNRIHIQVAHTPITA